MPTQAPPEAVTMTDLLAREYREPDGLVGDDIIVRGTVNVLGGHPKTGKSIIVKNLALCLAAGVPWLGFATKPSRVLMLQAEIPEPRLQARLRLMRPAWCSTLAAERVGFVTHRGIALDRTPGIQTCRDLIKDFVPDLLIIDPLARFYSGDENDTRDMSRLVSGLDSLIQSFGVAIVVVHHLTKPSDNGRTGAHQLRGAGALFGAVDSAILLAKARDSWILSFELRHGEEPAPLALERSKSLWYSIIDVPLRLVPVVDIVRSAPLAWMELRAAIVTATGKSQATAERLIRQATEEGHIGVRNGVYVALRGKSTHQTPSEDEMVDISVEHEREISPTPQINITTSRASTITTSPSLRETGDFDGGSARDGNQQNGHPPRRIFRPWYELQEDHE